MPPARRRLPERLGRGQGADSLARGRVLALLPAPGLGRVLLEPAVGVVERDPPIVPRPIPSCRQEMNADGSRAASGGVDHVWIPMPDGCAWRRGSGCRRAPRSEPVPAVLEYIPYRKDDGTVVRDARIAPVFRRARLRRVRVDLRGSGDSDGMLEDEYLPAGARGRRSR